MAYKVERPCFVHRCPEYAVPGGSRCQLHLEEFERERRADPTRTGRRGTDAAWRRARGLALWRAKYTCQECGCKKDQLRRPDRLEVHHVDGDSTNHAQGNLRVLCSPCHRQAEAEKRRRRT